MSGHAITIAVTVAAGVITYLLAQPDVVFSPAIKVVLGAASIGLTILARFLPSEGTPVQVEVTKVPE